MKRIGWVRYSDNKPLFELTQDDYTCGYLISTTVVFKTKKEALKRFEDVRPVFVGLSGK